ncbi:Ig-like domain-containing protein [Pseudovibrio sp. Tun.PSC04-5.I4]|uniref:Ig-like domain-containing protein n=1 Tax=Pseudovibrio sp. Tun.PSC04-5.I4 TaxID=1798213 RepID=UPI00087F1E2A|nr:Ig-like domain-containing protein [Pseudovibrio sp. Tun.PSC04-5.I4]SDR09508.1 Ig-like domain (group 1) [Pseudovibrio sp. Tun.PSC04-5.I4]
MKALFKKYIINWFLLVSLVLFAASAPASAQQVEIIRNGDFSNGSTNWDLVNVAGTIGPRLVNGRIQFNGANEAVFGDYIEQTFQNTIVSGIEISISLLLSESGGAAATQEFTIEIRSPTDTIVDTRVFTVLDGGSGVENYDVTLAGDADSIRIINSDATNSGAGSDGYVDDVSITIDAPSATLSGLPAAVNTDPFTVIVTFSEDVTGFDDLTTDLTVANGDLTSISGGPAAYTAEITPDGGGDVSLTVPADAALDGSGNGNTASATSTVLFDAVAPSATLSGVPANVNSTNPFTGTVTFSENVTGFDDLATDLTVANGTLTNITGGPAAYTVEITPDGSGDLSLTVPADAGQDVAGNGNTASATSTVLFDDGSAASITVSSGGTQETEISSAFTDPLVVTVQSSSGNPVASVIVTFTAPSSGASLNPAVLTATTDASGEASLDVTANSTVGAYTVVASVGGVATTADFPLTNSVGAAASITADSGSPQDAVISTAFTNPLVVTVRDSGNNPVPNETVTFTAPSTNASLDPDVQTETTDAAGQISLSVTANSTVGAYTVVASVGGVATTADFPLTNSVGAAASITADSGSPQDAVISTAFSNPLVVTVRDSGNNPVPNETVTFTAPSTNASLDPDVQTETTDAAGQISLSVTANSTVGAYTVVASVGGVATTADFPLTNSVGAAASITADSGSPQDAVISTAFTNPLVVTVRDSGNNPVPNETVTFTAPSTNASLDPDVQTETTDAAGQISLSVTANSTVGAYTVVASIGGVATTADFPLTNSVGAAASITADSGSPQDAVISTAFTNPLVVTVRDSGNNPVPNETVTFTAPSTNASLDPDVQTETTDAAGQISLSVTANSTVGAYTVVASVGGVATTADFPLTNSVGAAASITADSGSPQDAVISTAFTNPLVVTVRDSGNNPVPNETVTFTAPSTNASLDPDVQTETTDAAGQISLSVTANSTVGAYTVVASVGGVATTADFPLTNSVGAAASITADSGSPQDAVISTAFSNPLVVTVLDSGNNPVPNETVTFTAPSTNASLDPDVQTETTDAAGQISLSVTANSTVGAYTVVASVGGVATTADFPLTNSVGAAASITADSGSPQDAVISTAFANPLVVTVRDSGNNPVPNETVTFTAPSTNASLDPDVQTETTDAAGQISLSVTANSTVGAYTVVASVGGVATTADFPLTNSVGAAASITADSGSPQDAVISTAFSNPLVVTVRDSGNNPVPNETVTFTAPSTNASLDPDVQTETTDAAGQISLSVTANSTVGAYTVVASVGGVATTADFPLTNSVGAAASITADSGSPQDAVISTAFANPLVVTVRDSGNNPVPNETVTFTAPSSGASLNPAVLTATTDASGEASLDVTANSTVGAYTVVASVGGVATTADFPLTNSVGAAASITADSGSPQDAVISTAFANPLVVTVRDSGNNPVPNETVTFTAPSTNASLDPDVQTETTDAAGQISLSVTANSTVGAYTVVASVGGVATTADFPLTNSVGAAASITADSGSPQDAVISTAFANPLVVTVRDSGNNPVPNETVTFTAPSSGASLNPAVLTATTDASGEASLDVTANSTVGAYTVVASVGGVATTADFPLTNSVGAAASITADSGSPQDAVISTAFTNPLVVTVLDSGTNPVPNVVVTFTAPSNGASLSSDVQTETTDAAGQISFIVTANSTVGAYTVEASVVGGATTADFSLTNTVGAAATISADSGSPQDAVISTAFANPLVVTVLDSGTNPVPNVVVTFTAPSNGASLSSDVQTETTDAAGQISFIVTANSTVGAYTVEASVVGGATTADFSLTNTVGAAATISADSGSPQDAVISTAFANPLVVTVLDSGTNPVPNVVVTFTAPSNGASLSSDVQTETTDAAGQISFIVTANSTVGAYTVEASVVGGATTAEFSLTNTVGAAATISADSGSPQDAVISTAFANPLVVTVLDSGTNPVPNVVVTFTAPSNGASLSSDVQTETTDAAGQISFIVTANSTVGAYTVEASVVGGATTADFSLTNTVGAAATISADSGSPQDAVISTAFSNPLVVTVRDSGNNPVPNETVTFTAPSTNASLDPDVQTETTDAAGQISLSVTANSTVGAYTVVASVGGVATTADFPLTNSVGAAASITADSGSPQDAVISTAFANPLVVTVRDSGNNPVPNETVTFTAPSSGASLNPAVLTATTDASGEASLDVTANSTVGAYTVVASVGGVATTADFPLTNSVGAAASITADSGSPQDAVISTAFSNPLVVTVRDSGNNPVPNETVTFTAPSTNASLDPDVQTETTDAAGQISLSVTANSTVGAYTVVASVGGVATTADFPLTNSVGAAASITADSGSPQDAVISTAFANPLVVTVRDSGNNPVPNETVTFTAPSSGASLNPAVLTATTDASGEASLDVTANSTVGAYTVVASVGGVATTADFPLTNSVGAAASITADSGSPQDAVISTAFTNPLVVTVRDSGNNPVPNETVTFTAPSTNASLDPDVQTETTDAAGQISLSVTANSTVGAYTVVASVGGVATTADFPLTNSVGAAASITADSGSPQDAVISTAFTNPLVVTVRDSGNNPVPNETVTFTAPSTNASLDPDVQTETTDAAGQISLSVTANSTVGAYTVVASVGGVATTADFPLTNSVGAAASITADSGSPQDAVISTAFSNPLVVTVRDSGNNPVPNETVTFTAPSTNASLDPDVQTETTDAAGQISLSVTANSTVGAYTVVASVGGVATTADFPLTNSVGAAASITADSGSPQDAVISTAFSNPLVVTVRDSGNNPVPNETVTFTAPSTNASLDPDVQTETTDAAGQISLSVTANSTVGAYTVVASVGGVATTADFPLTNSVGAAASITADSGSPQDAVISTAFTNPLVVTVRDSGNNPVPNETVTFTAPSTNASLDPDVQTETTDAAGQISLSVTANSTVGAYTVVASVGGVATTADFPLTNSVGAAASITADSGSPQDAVISTAFTNPLVVTVRDSGNNPVPNETVTFTAPSTNASLDPDVQTETTDAAGQISLSVTANSTVGAYTVVASVGGVATTADFPLTNSVGAAASITADSGSPQDAVISTAFTNPLVVTVRDSGNNPVPNETVTFTAPSTNASLDPDVQTETTDAAGQISLSVTANSTVGAYTVVASVGGVATTADFPLTNSVGAAASITADSGSPQDAVISTAFSNPLVVTVLDSGNNPVPNETVTFTAPSTNASLDPDVQTETTDAAGQISLSVTANSTVGAYTVVASVGGVATTADFPLTNSVGAAASITADSGSPQDAVISTAFTNPLVVTVRDSGNNPVPNETVTFTAPSTNASLDPDVQTETTDAAGQISLSVTANSTVGAYTVVASVGGVATTADFPLTNSVGAAASITADSGSPQDAVISTAFANPLVVTVLDSGNNPVPNETVTFTAPSTNASLDPDVQTATTDAAGQISLSVTANSTVGAYTVVASVGGVATTADFPLTNSVGAAASITADSGSPQDAVISTAFTNPLVVTVRDSGNNPVPNETVTFTAPSTNASLDPDVQTETTDAAGQISLSVTANSTVGAYTVVASVGGVATTADFPLTNSVGAAASITADSGSPQDAVISTAFSNPLVVTVRDSGNNPVPNETVTFTAPSTNASLDPDVQTETTDAAGQISLSVTANSTVGAYTVVASVGGVATTADFPLTNSVGAAASITADSGSPQDAVISTAFTNPLVVTVRDSGNNPVPNETVTFTAPSTNASLDPDVQTETTDAAGQISLSVTANSTVGAYTVVASIGGVATTADFPLTNSVGAAASITADSGSPQDAVISTAFTNPLVVTVRDSGNNPVPNETVTFTAPSTNASLDPDVQTETTDAAGQISLSVTANSTVGAYTVVASVGGVATTADFPLTNSVGAAASITADSGSPQDAVISTAFTNPLVVTVRDSGNNPVPNETVTFTAPSTNASLDPDVQTETTDAAGQISLSVTANSTVGAYTVVASVGGVATTADFPLTNSVGAAASITADSGSPQDAVISTAFSNPLVVTVLDSGNNPVPNETVTFTAPSTNASLDPDVQTETTDAAGQISLSVTANSTVGAYTVVASVGGVATTADFPLTNSVGAAASITADSGSPQDAVISTAFANPLVVTVRDSGNNPVPNETVTFTAPSTNASLDPDVQTETTDAAGQISLSVTANSTVGAYTVVASVGGVATTADFPLTNSVGAAASITADSGSPQDAVISTAFSNPLVVTVRDSGNNPVPNETVTFTAPSTNASLDPDVQTETTDAAGQISLSVTANSTVGAYTVVASVGGVATTADFPLTNSVGAAASITADSGSPQDAVISTAFANPLVVTVRDSGNNPVPNETVTFTAPSSGQV